LCWLYTSGKYLLKTVTLLYAYYSIPHISSNVTTIGEFTTFDFIPGLPAPFNFFWAILTNQKMLTLFEKLQSAPALLPMLIEGQPFIDAQDELSCLEFMEKYGMPDRINSEVSGVTTAVIIHILYIVSSSTIIISNTLNCSI
jgi:hypothetical protein